MGHQKLVSVVVEITDQGCGVPSGSNTFADLRYSLSVAVVFDRKSHQLRTRFGELNNLGDRCFHVGRIGICHTLNANGIGATDAHIAYHRFESAAQSNYHDAFYSQTCVSITLF